MAASLSLVQTTLHWSSSGRARPYAVLRRSPALPTSRACPPMLSAAAGAWHQPSAHAPDGHQAVWPEALPLRPPLHLPPLHLPTPTHQQTHDSECWPRTWLEYILHAKNSIANRTPTCPHAHHHCPTPTVFRTWPEYTPSGAMNSSLSCLYLWVWRKVTLARGAPRPGSWMMSLITPFM